MNNPPQAINLVLCNPDGYLIGDVILFYLAENTYTVVGIERINNWLEYNIEKADGEVTADVVYHREGDRNPPDFRFQVQGPNAKQLMTEVVDGTLPDLSFLK